MTVAEAVGNSYELFLQVEPMVVNRLNTNIYQCTSYYSLVSIIESLGCAPRLDTL
jgi:hypothetical protein